MAPTDFFLKRNSKDAIKYRDIRAINYFFCILVLFAMASLIHAIIAVYSITEKLNFDFSITTTKEYTIKQSGGKGCFIINYKILAENTSSVISGSECIDSRILSAFAGVESIGVYYSRIDPTNNMTALSYMVMQDRKKNYEYLAIFDFLFALLILCGRRIVIKWYMRRHAAAWMCLDEALASANCNGNGEEVNGQDRT